ncbi:MAG: sialate O-acetylesterase [Cyclobacteriaceae bacterium]|nr:sialate O-acetylesterase [Cyclobacteriaceae bacterium]
MIRLLLIPALISASGLQPVLCQIKLHRLISDGAVLQRNVPVPLQGSSTPFEVITLTFGNALFTTRADSTGMWKILLPPQPAGGPHTLRFSGTNEVVVHNILFGDVWICSGQSNMEMTVERVKEKYRALIEQSFNPYIRHFEVPDRYDFKRPHPELTGGQWKEANPENVLEFSAVAWFFAKDLFEHYKVPIGLINASLGGSPAEAWMSEDALKAFPEAYAEMQRFKDDAQIKEIESTDSKNASEWYYRLNTTDSGLRKWHLPNLDDTDWPTLELPTYWPAGSGLTTGAIWLRKVIEVPEKLCGKSGSLWLGRIVDADSVFINGEFVGTTSYQYPPRRYSFGPGVLHPGKNIIAVRVINSAGRGGFVPDKPYFLAVGSDTLDLTGSWKYRQGCKMPPIAPQTFIRWKPGGLYNGMIAPLIQFPVKGVIWYQGESNTNNPQRYREVFPSLISNWREKWKLGNLPFLYVQLANFMEAKPQPSESNWAELRQAQLETLNKVPAVAMAVTIDAGEWNDIHPLDKQTVGKRLALAARHVAYGENQLVYSGPLYKRHTIRRNKVVLYFNHTGSGLWAKGSNALQHFSIAGADKKFVWANARIKNNKVIVWSDAVQKPAVVRYAWADNPHGANLYNKEGLPASPFTTGN